MAYVRYGDPEFMIQLSSVQRGLAAHMRQADDNLGYTSFKRYDRQFLNKVIHDASMDHRPEFDKRLEQLAKLTGVIDADATLHDADNDRRFKRLEQENLELKSQLEFALTELKNHQDNFTKFQRALTEVHSEFECRDFQLKILQDNFTKLRGALKEVRFQLKILMAVLVVLGLFVSWDFVILILQWIIMAVIVFAIVFLLMLLVVVSHVT